jgi:hypothetical protein
MVCRPKQKGGLGILNLKIQNEGLLLKYLHKFYNKVDTPWVHLLWNSYYSNKIPHAIGQVGSFWWRDVYKLMPIYRGIASSTVKDGSMTLFWKDEWLDNVKAETFPRAFSYCTNEDISIQHFLSAGSLADNFWLPLSPEALEEVREMQSLTAVIQMTHDHDTWTYKWGDKCTPSHYYNFCFRDLQPHFSFLWLWKSKCTPKVKFFFGWFCLIDLTPETCCKEDNFG